MIPLLLATVLSLAPQHIEQRRQIAEALEAHPEPALETRADLAKVDEALRTPEQLWHFVIAPETAWADRIVAAERGTLPMSFLPRWAAVDRELAAEEAVHGWNMDRFVRRNSQMFYVPRAPFRGSHARTVLGHDWTLPADVFDEPLTYDEKAAAPWPWQVRQAIAVLGLKFFDLARADEFWDVAVTLPRSSVEDAANFYRLTERFATLARRVDRRVIAVWREIGLRQGDFIALRPELSQAFVAIGMSRAGGQYRYGEVMLADWAEAWTGREIPLLARHLRALSAPPIAVEVLARRIDELAAEDVQTRGTAARDFLEAVDPGLLAKAGRDSDDPPRLERVWLLFRDWYEEHYDELREAALAHEKVLIRYR